MRIRIVPGKCSGHARCAAIAPDVYKLTDDGFNEMPETLVPPELEALARRGARACPERAIEILDAEA